MVFQKKKQRLTSTSVPRYKGFPLYQLIVQLSTAENCRPTCFIRIDFSYMHHPRNEYTWRQIPGETQSAYQHF